MQQWPNSNLLKECLDSLLPILTLLVSKSLEIGYFPGEWKSALVKPLLKKLDLELIFPSFRPVNNLPFISKLTEKVSVNQLSEHMNKAQPLPSGQSAYRPSHSTETALLKVQSDILLSMDDQKVTLLVMLDLSAAFDIIDQSILLENLGSGFGVGGTALKGFTSYLSQRTQQVQIKGTLSGKKQLTTGVRQGPCLGPVLFTFCRPSLDHRKAPPRSPGLCRWPSSLPVIQTHSFHESNSLSRCHWKLCGRTEELDDFQHAKGEWQQDRILDCRK